MKRPVFLHLEAILRDYPKMDNYIKERQSQEYYSVDDDRYVESLRWQKRCVHSCYLAADWGTKDVVQSLYFKPNPNLTIDGLAEHLHISRSTLFYRRNKFLENLRRELGW